MRYERIVKDCKTIEDKSLKLFGNKSKISKKIILKNEKINQNLLSLIYSFKQAKINLDYINFNELLKKEIYPAKENKVTIKFIKQLKSLFSDKIIVRLFNEIDFNLSNHLLIDSINGLNKIVNNEKLFSQLKRKKIRSFYYLHTHIHRLLLFIEVNDFDLEQKDNVLQLDNKEYKLDKDIIKIVVPKTKHDLIKCGQMFDFCIGTHDGYANNILKGYYSFIAIFKNNQPLQGILFDQKRIIESFNKGNNSANFEIKHFLREVIFKTKRIEADSSWISHFEYENNVLTLVTKQDKEYYYNVTDELVNELENSHSRGRFFHYYIKGRSVKEVA